MLEEKECILCGKQKKEVRIWSKNKGREDDYVCKACDGFEVETLIEALE